MLDLREGEGAPHESPSPSASALSAASTEVSLADDLLQHCEACLQQQGTWLEDTRTQLVEADGVGAELREATLHAVQEASELRLLECVWAGWSVVHPQSRPGVFVEAARSVATLLSRRKKRSSCERCVGRLLGLRARM